MTSYFNIFGFTRNYALILLVLITISCDWLTAYKQTVRSGIATLPWPKQMEELYGEGDHFITHYGFDTKPKHWNTEVFFGGRYVLTIQVYVVIDYAKNAVVKTTAPAKFYVKEVAQVETLPDGRVSTKYGSGWELDETQWNQLVTAKGDWSVLGISLKTNDPVSGFDAYVKAWSGPRVRVK
jgi:hypothetical protein